MIFLLTPFRPGLLDFDTALSLALLGLIIVATAALPLYVEVRAAVARALELANPDAMVGTARARRGSDARAKEARSGVSSRHGDTGGLRRRWGRRW